MSESFLAIGSAIIGFVSKSIWDYFWKARFDKNQAALRKRTDFLERQLSEFYWPILIQLEKNDMVWNQVKNSDLVKGTISNEFYNKMKQEFFFPNNEEILRIIETKFYLSQSPDSLNSLIQEFVKHQSIFQGIKLHLKDDTLPDEFGIPYPAALLEEVRNFTEKLQKEYDKLIGI